LWWRRWNIHDHDHVESRGSFGCPERGADRAEGCYGPQPDLLLRLAVVEVGETTLLAIADEPFAQRYRRTDVL
jgi:hypothetical protein